MHGARRARGASWPAVVVLLGLGAGCAGPGLAGSGSPATRSAEVSGSPTASGAAVRYVALGDSYTIGTSVAADERWPDQLVRSDAGSGRRLELVANLGVNGFISADVIAVELPRLDALRPEFASLLIGVNDVVQGVPEATYRANLGRIFDALLARLPANRILVVTTPDYTVTPAGGDYGDPATQRSGIRRNNAILAELAAARGIVVVDIFDISEGASADRALVAGDGLHPSGKQYGLWVERIAPAVRALLEQP